MQQNDINKHTYFDGHYFIVRTLSTEGGTADVFLAVDMNTIDTSDWSEADKHNADKIIQAGMLVAIKQYRPKNALDINGKKCFRDEYMIVHNCRHTNLLKPNHFSIYNDIPYLELPYCKNGSSETLIAKSLSEKQLWTFIRDVAAGLSYIHALNPPIIHQDIKPANILIDDQGRYAITDFGISVSRAFDTIDYSLDEEYSGTMAYMAPERFTEDYSPIPQSDIWALGVTLYEILVNNVPFGDYGGEVQLREDYYDPLPNSVPSSIRTLIHSCLALDPDSRPSAADIAEMANKHLKSGSAYNRTSHSASSKSDKGSISSFIKSLSPLTRKIIITSLAALSLIVVIVTAIATCDNTEQSASTEGTQQVQQQGDTQHTDGNEAADMAKQLHKARQLAEVGYQHGEGYINQLLLARDIYNNVLHSQDLLKKSGQSVEDLSSETQKLDSALQGACQEMQQKVEALKAAGETEAAQQIENALTEVISSINNNQ